MGRFLGELIKQNLSWSQGEISMGAMQPVEFLSLGREQGRVEAGPVPELAWDCCAQRAEAEQLAPAVPAMGQALSTSVPLSVPVTADPYWNSHPHLIPMQDKWAYVWEHHIIIVSHCYCHRAPQLRWLIQICRNSSQRSRTWVRRAEGKDSAELRSFWKLWDRMFPGTSQFPEASLMSSLMAP